MERFVEIKTPIELFAVSLTAKEEKGLIMSLTKPQKRVLNLLYKTPGMLKLSEFNEALKEQLGYSEGMANLISKRLKDKALIYVSEENLTTKEKYLLVMPTGMRIMSVLFSKRG